MPDITKQVTDHAYTLLKQKEVLLRGYDHLLNLLLSPEDITKQQLVSIIQSTLKKSTLE